LFIVFNPVILARKILYDKCLDWIVNLTLNDNYYTNIGARLVLRTFLELKKWNLFKKEKLKRDGSHLAKEKFTLDQIIQRRFVLSEDNEKFRMNKYEAG